ncbi:MAG: VWA domain-containing protein [Saprospiraceae bacterium]|nr:VWA domain-containing protein [Saprospiraceae bacterium]
MKRLNYILVFLLLGSLYNCTYLDDGYYAESDYGNYEQGDNYEKKGEENPFINVADEPISTFSIDADGASYANVRRFIKQDNILPPKAAIRTEELINYFNYDYPFENFEHPIFLSGEVSACPWKPANKLVRIGIKGESIPENNLPASNFIFLIDISGSMSQGDKLDLLKEGFKSFVDKKMKSDDKVAIVTYAGASRVHLESTAGTEKSKIKDAIDELDSGGSTAGAEGIITAYEIAEQNFIVGGNNRIIIGTDGDFNVGPVSQDELVALIEEKRETGVFITVLGVGRGNLNDAALEQIANNGNGTYEYIDNLAQLEKVFIHEFEKFFTVAKDVKVQVEFNPANVEQYRLIGYENRLLNEEDFEDDKKDAGEIGANQSITALYEIVPKDNIDFRTVPTFSIDFRYKKPDADVSIPMELDIYDEGNSFEKSSDFMKFTSGIAAFAMLITDSEYKEETNYNDVIDWLKSTNLKDVHGFKSEFIKVVEKAEGM